MDDMDRDALEAMIDAALEESFPASDPPAFTTPAKRQAKGRRRGRPRTEDQSRRAAEGKAGRRT